MHTTIALVISTLVLSAYAQSDSITLSGGASETTQSPTATGADYATSGTTYADESSVLTITGSTDYATISDLSSIFATSNGTATSISSHRGNETTSSPTQTLLVGSARTTTSLNGTAATNGTASSTSTSAQPTNTVPCNGHPALCNRKFSNITHVGAHNSPFVRPGNIAANQELDVETQLNDGIRMLQFQAHLQNDTIYLCHTSCDLLNVGTLEDYLTTVARWLRGHPYDVIAILIGNYDVINPMNFTAPVTNSGLIDFVYTPPTQPMPLESWPTLAEMIFRNTRAVVMLDYEANQTAIPWLLDEFSQMWETPFSPTDRDFPCTPQRPPDQERPVRQNRMFMANHNLNLEVAAAGLSIDVPFFTLLNETNADQGYGSAAAAVANCTTMWDRPPTFLLVDYYNIGNFNGSVFQSAADANGVPYDRASCCGTAGTTNDGNPLHTIADLRWYLAIFMVVYWTSTS
ncbi:hypothetical protein H2200_013218 [Cladophialophora chaetospira]|uniref:PLC-like phosphodiesterase n=1 Tax=Cladophialophora chaetospira TaxID=386627 RepID=A0AA38WWD5_9EURO|nr:hypothetical protein H2200_013218 [Cladophialophora chaetospira]